MGGCASKPKEIDSAPCEAPATPKSNYKNNITNKGVEVQAPPLVHLSESSEKAVVTEPEPKTEEKVEVTVVDDSQPAFARPAKSETEKKVIMEANSDQNAKEIGKKVEGKVKQCENKIELTIDQKAAIEAEPTFATQAVEKKAESTKEIEKKVEADIKAKEPEKKINDEGVSAWPVKTPKADATKESEGKVEDFVAPETKAKGTEKEIEQEAAFDTDRIFSSPVKTEVESTKAIEKKFEAKENEEGAVHDVEPELIWPVKTKVETKKKEEKVEAKENEKKDKSVEKRVKENTKKVQGIAEKTKESTNEKKVEDKATEKETENDVSVDDELAFSGPLKSKVETTKEIEKTVEAAVITEKAKEIEKDKGVSQNAKENEREVEGITEKAKERTNMWKTWLIRAKAAVKDIEKKVEAPAVPSTAKETEKKFEPGVEGKAKATANEES